MNSQRVLCLVIVTMLVYGCTNTQTPTVDLPARADAAAATADMDLDGVDANATIVDMGIPIDQAFIPSSEPIPTRVTTSLGVDTVAAGATVSVTCTVYDNVGEEMPDATTRLDVRPLDGISAEGTMGVWTLIGERVGTYRLFCTAPNDGLRDSEGATLNVTPGPVAWTQALVEPEVVVAGATVSVTCERVDAFGNRITSNPEDAIQYSPDSPFHILSGTQFTTTVAGEITFQCPAANAETTSAVLVVQPDIPSQLTASLSPLKMTYQIGEVVSVSYLVSDQYGNSLLSHPIDISADDELTPFGPRRYRITTEGFYTITVSVPNTEPQLTVDLPIKVDSRGPTLDCDGPNFGQSVVLPATGRLTLSGYVRDLSGVESVTLNGNPIEIDDNGRFNEVVEVNNGVNFFDIAAADTLGQTTRSLCGFFAAPAYAPDNDPIDNTIRLDLRQGAVDDGDNGNNVRSFGDIARIAVRSDGLRSLIDGELSANPNLLGAQDFSIGKINWIRYQGNLAINNVDLSLGLQGNALGVNMSLGRVKFDARVKGKIYVPIFPDITCEFDGELSVNGVNATSAFSPRMSGGAVILDSNGTTVSVQNVDTDFGGVCGNLVDLALSVVGAFSSVLENTVAEALASLIDDSLAGLLGDTISGLDFSAFAFDFELEGFDGQTSNLALQTTLTDVSVNTQRLRLGLGTRVNGPTRNALASLGIPRLGSVVGNSYPENGSMSALLNAALINQVMYGLWRANFFNISDIGAGAAGGTGNLNASITLLAPPAAEILPEEGRFRLHFGPATGSLAYADLFSDPVQLRFGAVLSADIELEDGQIVFAPSGLEFETLRLDIEDSGLPADLAQALEDEIAQIVATLLNDAVSGAFPTLPIPTFTLPDSVAELGLPPGLSLGIQGPQLEMDEQTMILNGDFGQ